MFLYFLCNLSLFLISSKISPSNHSGVLFFTLISRRGATDSIISHNCLAKMCARNPLCLPGARIERGQHGSGRWGIRAPAPRPPLLGGRIRTHWERFPLAGGLLRKASCTTLRPIGDPGLDASVCGQQFEKGAGEIHASWCVLRYTF